MKYLTRILALTLSLSPIQRGMAIEAGPVHLITLPDAINYAVSANQEYLNLLDRTELASLDYQGARAAYKTKFLSSTSSDARSGTDVGSTYSLYLKKKNPSGSALSAGLYSYTFGDNSLSEIRFSYTLPFFQNPLNSNSFALAKAETDFAKRKRFAEIGEQELINKVVDNYLKLILAAKTRGLAGKQLEVVEHMHEATQIRAQHGEISEIEFARSELRLAQAKQNFNMADFRHQNLEDGFKVLLALDMREPIAVQDEFPAKRNDWVFSQPLDELEEKALREREEVLGQRETMMTAYEKMRASTGSLFPPIEVSLQYALVGEGDSVDESFELDEQRFGVGFRMDTDFGISTQRREQRRYQLLYKTAQRDYDHLKAKVAMEVRQAYFNVKQNQELLALANTELQLSENNYQWLKLQHEKGLVDKLSLLEAEHKLQEAKFKELSARVNYLLSGQQLAMASATYEY